MIRNRQISSITALSKERFQDGSSAISFFIPLAPRKPAGGFRKFSADLHVDLAGIRIGFMEDGDVVFHVGKYDFEPPALFVQLHP